MPKRRFEELPPKCACFNILSKFINECEVDIVADYLHNGLPKYTSFYFMESGDYFIMDTFKSGNRFQKRHWNTNHAFFTSDSVGFVKRQHLSDYGGDYVIREINDPKDIWKLLQEPTQILTGVQVWSILTRQHQSYIGIPPRHFIDLCEMVKSWLETNFFHYEALHGQSE